MSEETQIRRVPTALLIAVAVQTLGGLIWAGGAHAYHQWHPVSSPPWEHIEDIVANANRFHDKWGTFPMEGWLEAFEAEGAVEKQEAPKRYILRNHELHHPRGKH